MSATASLPDRIGRFHIRSMLGRGAMGIVYLGHDEEIDRLVAIKLIRADLLDTEEREGYLKRFRNEAKIAGRCMHANIVGLYDFAMHDENPYLVMEYVDGIGLQQFFPRGTKLPVHEVIHIALQVLDALHYAHGRSIVHRDIKPANILMMPDLSLKITDFGISRLTSMELTVTPLLIGTPSYMSPEQCLGSALDGRNDLFSLGCVLYELVAGERAFSGVNYTETIFSIVNKPHVPLSQLRDDLPPGFSDAIDKALAKSPDQRHANAASFARILDDIARDARLPRSGMPPVIVDTARVGGSPAARSAAGEEAQPTISVPMTETTLTRASGMVPVRPTAVPPTPEPTTTAVAAVAPVESVEPAPVVSDEDPDATLKRVLVPPPRLTTPTEQLGEPSATVRTVVQPVSARPEPRLFDTGGDRPDTTVRDWPPMVAADHADNTLLQTAPGLAPAPQPVREPTEAGSVSFTPGPHFALPAPLGDAERSRIVDCLATVIGPIAPLLARRVEQPGMSAAALAGVLAGHVRHDEERRQFETLVESGRTP